MLKLLDKVKQAIERNHVKEIKRNRTNEVAAAYVARLTQGRKVDTVRVVNTWDNRKNAWSK